MSDTPLQRNGTANGMAAAPMSCEEAQLHKERLQALAEKRKRQTEIEEKRGQLDDMVLQLQHLKSKAMRERWLLQGTGAEVGEARMKQLEKDEAQGKSLEDQIHRLESEIGALESEESQISAKEQVLRDRLKETERSIEDLQKSLMTRDGDALGCMSAPRSDHTDPDSLGLATQPPTGHPPGGEHATPRPAMFAMEINVQRDPRTGEQRVLSASRVDPADVSSSSSRGIKVFDDGRKVVYEVSSSGGVSTTSSTTANSAGLENGWSSAQVDQLIQSAARPASLGTVVGGGGGGGAGGDKRGQVTVTPATATTPYIDDDLSPPSCAPPSVPSSPPAQVVLQREPRLGMMPPSASAPASATSGTPVVTAQPGAYPSSEVTRPPPQASSEHPITMVFLGYQDVEDTSESRRLLGFDGAVKAEVVLIDDDDEKSLREKTVTDMSIADGTAADLVSGRPGTSEAISTELSSDGREPDSASSPTPAANEPNAAANAPPPPGLTPATGKGRTPGVTMTTANGYQASSPTRQPHTAMKPWRAAEDVSETIPRERALKSVSFQESVSVISDRPTNMELESQQIQHGCFSSPSNLSHNTVGVMVETDSDVMQEIRYLDQVLDAASDTPTNGNASPSAEHTKTTTISVDGNSPGSVCVSASSPVHQQPIDVVVEGHRQTTYLHQDHSAAAAAAARTNGHAAHADTEPASSRAKFELRAFQEERRPAKLFTPGEEQQVRVTRRRPTEEVHELERERQELIKDQAVKKNPGMGVRWWNPPQEVPLEAQLDSEKLESLKKYQERKQQKQSHTYVYTQPQVSGPPTMVTFDPELHRKEDIMEEQIDFSSARKQFLQSEANKRDVAPQIYSAKPFSKATTNRSGLQGSGDIFSETGEGHVTWSDEGIAGEFMCARAVMTMLPEDEDLGKGHFHPEESDSGLDDLSVRSQDTTVFSLDNISDSGASLPPTPLPLTPVSPPTPQPTTPVNGRTATGSPSEDELEYHAGVLVQNAIQHALAAQNGGGEDEEWRRSSDFVNNSSQQLSSPRSPVSSTASTMGSPFQPVSSSPVSSSSGLQSPVYSSPEVRVVCQGEEYLESPQQQHMQTSSSPTPPTSSQTVSPPQRPKNGGPRIKIQSSYARALASSNPAPAQAVAPALATAAASVPRPTPVYRPPSPPSPDKQEFSYFSKYSEAAELRSTATAGRRAPEAEPAAGPFRLRSNKQRTLSMIEEEIRAAQQREEELKKQRESQPTVVVRQAAGNHTSISSSANSSRGVRKSNVSPADKMKSNSLPARLTLTARTAPGKIEKVRPAPPVSPSPSEGALSDAGSEDSGGSRPKNFMQTLMEDYETHKVKRRDKLDDNSVLEATRVTKRKSDMARKWEAGIYANEDGEDEEEEEEEEEE